MFDYDGASAATLTGHRHLRVRGGTALTGSIDVKTSKNAGVALLCASLLNRGPTVLRRVARIEEVNRILRVLTSMGVEHEWLGADGDLRLQPPERLDLTHIDAEAAHRTRSIIMFLGPLLHDYTDFELPFPGGCELGDRTVEPHLAALRRFGLSVERSTAATTPPSRKTWPPPGSIVLTSAATP